MASVACDLAAGQPPQQEASRWCRKRARRPRPPPARPRRGRGARRSWSPRSRGRARSPVLAVTAASWPSALQRRRRGRRCGDPARRWPGGSGGRCARSQTTVVSRWLVMPMRGDVARGDRRLVRARRARRPRWSTRCPRGRARPSRTRKMLRQLPAPMPRGASPASNTMARLEVVPWSMARMCAAICGPSRRNYRWLRNTAGRDFASFAGKFGARHREFSGIRRTSAACRRNRLTKS